VLHVRLQDSGLDFILFSSLFYLIFYFHFYLRDSNIMLYMIVIMITSFVTYVIAIVTILYNIEDSRIIILYSIITIYWS